MIFLLEDDNYLNLLGGIWLFLTVITLCSISITREK